MAALLAAMAAALLAAAAAAIVPVANVPADPDPTLPAGAVRVDVASTPVSRPVPPGFIGLSIEYRSAQYYFGSDPAAPNPLFISLLRQLTSGQSPVIRLGGDTTDWTWWRTPGVSKPPGIRYTLGSHWVQATRAAAQVLGARLILGINFESDSAAIARKEAGALLNGLGRNHIAGFELGNEPEAYGTLGWYENAAGVGVPGRPAAYNFAAYLRDYHRVSAALPTGVPLVGPASGAGQWLTGLGRYLQANPRARLVTYHRYPLHRCFTPRNSPDYPTIPNLLAPVASSGPADSLQQVVDVAHAHGRPLRADELNSVSCGGARRVSDTFASALWALDTLFHMARVGVDGVNIHTFRNAVYEPFAFSHSGGRWTARVRPMYYGLLLFARAAPPGARLLATTTTAAPPKRPGPAVATRAGPAVATRAVPPGLRVWATRAPDGRARVVLINDSLHHSVTTAVQPPPGPTSTAGATVATAEVLRAPRAGARRGITIAGQSFGSKTTTATLAGSLHQRTLRTVQGRFVVRLRPASAVLLTIGG
jgi:hypothetical protein